MSDFGPAVAKTLANEGGYFHNTETGEVVNHGITLMFLRSVGILRSAGPATESDIEFIEDLSVDAATDLYQQYFWDAGNFAALNSQPLADKAFDLAVNMGLRTSVEMLQQALNDIGIACETDGKLGPETATSCNAANTEMLYGHYILDAEERYQKIAEQHPDLASDLPAWLDRLYKN